MAVSNFASIQMFRAVAANAVVLSHLAVIEIKYSHGFVILPQWFGFAGSCGVYFFFVISGAVMGLIAPRGDWRQFLPARVLRIYPIYWIYTSAVLAVFLVVPGIVNTSYQQQPSILKSYLLWPQEVGPLLVVGWTLIHEMYFYLVIAAMLIFAVPLGYGLAVWALIVVGGYLMLGPAYGPVLAVVFNPMTLQFILGACVGLLLRQGYVSFAGIALIAGMIGFLIGAALHVAWGLPLLGPESVVLLGLPFVLIVYGGAALELRGRWRRLKWLERLGDASYSTYLSHVLVLSLAGRAWNLFPFHNWLIEVGFVTTGLVIANLFGLLSFNYLERPILALRRLIPRPKRANAMSSA